MNVDLRSWVVGCLGGIGALAIIACADTGSGDVVSGDDAGRSFIPDAEAPEADTVDGGVDATADASRACSDENFCHTAVPPQEVFRGVWGDAAGIVWAATESGRIFRWDGGAWTLHTEALGASFRGIWGSGPTDIWAVGVSGVMHGTGSSSSTIRFVPVDVPGDPTVALKGIWGSGPDDIWVVGGAASPDWPNDATSRVLHYTGSPDGGGHGWELAGAPGDIDYQGVWGSPGSGVWVRGTHEPSGETGWSPKGVVWRLRPGTTTWEAVDLPSGPASDWQPLPGEITAAGLSSDSSVWLAGANQSKTKVYWRGTSDDGGKSFTWTCIPRPSDLGLTNVWGFGPDDTWAAGEYGRLRHWDGRRWKQAAIMVTAVPVKKVFYGIWGLGNDDFWVVGDGIALHKTTLAGP